MEKAFTDSALILEFLQDQQMPLLVVLLSSALSDPFEDAPGEIRVGMSMGNRDIGDVLPGLVRHPGNDLQHSEFGKSFRVSVQEVHGNEKQAGEQTVATRGAARVLACSCLSRSEVHRSIGERAPCVVKFETCVNDRYDPCYRRGKPVYWGASVWTKRRHGDNTIGARHPPRFRTPYLPTE